MPLPSGKLQQVHPARLHGEDLTLGHRPELHRVGKWDTTVGQDRSRELSRSVVDSG